MPEVTPRHATTHQRQAKPLRLLVILAVLLVLGLLAHRSPQPTIHTATEQAPATIAGFNKHLHSLTDPSSPWVIVNKQHPLSPTNFAPINLVVPNVPLKDTASAANMHVSSTTAIALQELFAAADNSGYHLLLSSGYRSYQYQTQVYGKIVQSQGQGSADEQSARPGYSEHQTGLAADVAPVSRKCDLQQCFGQTPEGQWLVANAYKYGFIIRYPADKQEITGYEYEPWHIRYVGSELSQEMHKQGVETLEEFFKVSGGVAYK
jgi:D-alanyl-D-alanine carboxypeptidase